MTTIGKVTPIKGSSSFLSHIFCGLSKKAIITLATFLPFGTTTTNVFAENNTEKERAVRKFAEDSWKTLRQTVTDDIPNNTNDSNYIWNNLISTFIVGDNTDILDLDNIRNEIIRIGKENPEIPINVLQSAIYSAGISAEAINNKISTESNSNELTKRKKDTLKLVLEYLNLYPQDTLEDGKTTRQLTKLQKINEKELEKAKNFQETVKFAISQLSSPEDIPNLVKSFFDIKDKDTESAVSFLDIFIYLNNNKTVKLPENLLNSLKEELTKNTESFNNRNIYFAKSILLLSQAKADNASSFCKRWFELKPRNEATIEADYIVLKALCLVAHNENKASEIFKQVAATFPNLFFDSYFHACKTNVDSPKRQGGQEIINFFNRNPKLAHELFKSLLDKHALDLTKEEAYSKALVVISALNSQDQYIEILRKVIKDSTEKEENKIIAINGLIKAKDKESITPLLDIALNQSNSQNLQMSAFKAVLLIDSPDILYKEFQDRLLSSSPFNLDLHLFKTDSNNEDHLFKILPGYTEEDTIYSFVSSLDIEYGGSKGYLQELTSNKNFKQKYLMPLINYLNECKSGKRIIDLKLAYLMIYTLSKSNFSEASELLADISTYPELYIRKAPPNQITNAEYTTTNTVFIKLIALSCFGDVIDLHNKDDKGAKVLHTISRYDSSSVFYTVSDTSLLILAQRYEKDSLSQVAEHHKQESIKNLSEYIKNTKKEKISVDWYVESNRPFILSSTIAKLGGAKELLKIVLDISKEKPRSNIVRAIIQSLHINGFLENDIEKIGLNTEDTNKLKSIYKDIIEERFWLGSIKDSGLTGKGVQIAVIDGGHIISPKGFYPTLEQNIIVPNELIGLHDPGGLLSRHAYSVVAGIKNIAPDVEIISLTWDDLYPIKPIYRPSFLANDNTVITFENLIEGIIQGKYNPKLANCSFGIKGWLINTKEDGIVGNLPNPDLRSALIELLANTGTLSIISIGNDYSKYPGDHRNGEIAEWNALGLRFLGNGKFVQPKNVIHASTLDEYNGSIAPFNGIQDPLRTNTNIESLGIHGTLILPSFYKHRGALENKPGSGSSFSAPRLTGVLGLLLEKANNSSLSLNPQELREAAFNSAKEIPNSKCFEVRKKLDVKKLFEMELSKGKN